MNNNKNNIKIGKYAKLEGAYLLQIRSLDKRYTAKLVVQDEDSAYRLHYILIDCEVDLLEVIKHKANLD